MKRRKKKAATVPTCEAVATDVKTLVNAFRAERSLSFEAFSRAWTTAGFAMMHLLSCEEFGSLIVGLRSRCLYEVGTHADLLQLIYHVLLSELAHAQASGDSVAEIACVYALFAVYFTQLEKPHSARALPVKIRITVGDWSRLKSASERIASMASSSGGGTWNFASRVGNSVGSGISGSKSGRESSSSSNRTSTSARNKGATGFQRLEKTSNTIETVRDGLVPDIAPWQLLLLRKAFDFSAYSGPRARWQMISERASIHGLRAKVQLPAALVGDMEGASDPDPPPSISNDNSEEKSAGATEKRTGVFTARVGTTKRRGAHEEICYHQCAQDVGAGDASESAWIVDSMTISSAIEDMNSSGSSRKRNAVSSRNTDSNSSSSSSSSSSSNPGVPSTGSESDADELPEESTTEIAMMRAGKVDGRVALAYRFQEMMPSKNMRRQRPKAIAVLRSPMSVR